MKKLILILLLLMVKIPIEDWGQMSTDIKLEVIKQIAVDFCQKENCHKVQVSAGGDDEFIYLRFTCTEVKI